MRWVNVRNISVVTGTWPFVKAFLLPEGLAFLPKPFVNLDTLLTKVQELLTEPRNVQTLDSVHHMCENAALSA